MPTASQGIPVAELTWPEIGTPAALPVVFNTAHLPPIGEATLLTPAFETIVPQSEAAGLKAAARPGLIAETRKRHAAPEQPAVIVNGRRQQASYAEPVVLVDNYTPVVEIECAEAIVQVDQYPKEPADQDQDNDDETNPLPAAFAMAGGRRNPLLSPIRNRATAACAAGSDDYVPPAPDAGDDATPASQPATPSDHDVRDLEQEENPPPVGSGGTQQDIEPPLPSSDSQEIADAVPLPTNPELRSPVSEWDFAQVETPMFISAAINEFEERPLQLTGNWSVKPHMSLTSYYDGNIFVRSNDTASDLITRLALGLSMRIGTDDSPFYLVGDYTAGFNWYAEHSNESNIDQEAKAQFQWTMPKTIIGVNLGVSSNTGSDIDATDRVRQQLYYAGITTHHTWSDKTSWDLNADYSRTDFNGLISSSQVEGQGFVNYEYSPKTQIGLGADVGYVSVLGGAGQVFEQPDVRMTYKATGKLTLIGDIGAQFRQFNGGGSLITPAASLQATWAMREGTTLSMDINRQIYVSALLDDQDYIATSVDMSVQQRITDAVDFTLGLGYVNSDYEAAATGVSASREDNFYYIRPAIEWHAYSWLSIGLFYEYSQNLSHGEGADSFSRDRGGVEFAFNF